MKCTDRWLKQEKKWMKESAYGAEYLKNSWLGREENHIVEFIFFKFLWKVNKIVLIISLKREYILLSTKNSTTGKMILYKIQTAAFDVK